MTSIALLSNQRVNTLQSPFFLVGFPTASHSPGGAPGLEVTGTTLMGLSIFQPFAWLATASCVLRCWPKKKGWRWLISIPCASQAGVETCWFKMLLYLSLLFGHVQGKKKRWDENPMCCVFFYYVHLCSFCSCISVYAFKIKYSTCIWNHIIKGQSE